MDDELQQLEAELKQLRPAAPSRAVTARIARELAGAAARRGPRWRDIAMWLGAAALPAAAAIAVVMIQFGRTRPASASAPTAGAAIVAAVAAADALKPVTAENVLYSASDEGIVTLADGTAARRERLKYVDTITWRNPRTNASLTWTVPREEVRVVPVVFQ